MTLQDKLDNIGKPKLNSFEKGNSKTVKDFWEIFIEPRLPKNIDVVIAWHNLIKAYVKMPNTVLGFRTGNTAGQLRRGWETVTNDGFSFFYTDNYFSHYFYKMSYDEYVPSLEEFYALMKSRKFPVRILSPMGTKNEPWEKEYAAFNISGKNPGLGKAGYKLAHILDAGKNFNFNGENLGVAEICRRYFTLGEVCDWEKNAASNLYSRTLTIPNEDKRNARALAEACFIRMVHPMNYFLSPKASNKGKIYNKYVKGHDIGEDVNLLSYVKMKFHERYTKNGIDYFQDFMDLVYPFEDSCHEDGNTVLNLTYSATPLNEYMNGNNNGPQKTANEFSDENCLEIELAYEYLYNPDTSFRKLEKEVMKIDSPTRGGGYKARTIINNLGIEADKKGILSARSIDEELKNAMGTYRRTLERIKQNYAL